MNLLWLIHRLYTTNLLVDIDPGIDGRYINTTILIVDKDWTMFRFNKDMEYALISLVELSRQEDEALLSARELSERFSIPYKLLARILQKLGADGMIASRYGSRDTSPYLASSKARSRYAMLGQIAMAPRR